MRYEVNHVLTEGAARVEVALRVHDVQLGSCGYTFMFWLTELIGYNET